ncbi:hypothetical protein V8G54_036757 [Vigna mungo]|uniref:Uncharacterized protein n=1 Tax=Vigna mungo TaxID=3915 RepID=A0AAQ3RFR3_VIGMU
MVRTLGIGPCSTGGEVPTEGAELVKRPGPTNWRWRKLRRGRASTVGVADDGLGSKIVFGEASGGDHVIVLRVFVGGDKDGKALTNMNVKGVIDVLDNVGAFGLDKLDGMALDPEVKGVLETNVAYSVLVGLARNHGVKGFITSITLGCFAIDVDTLWDTNRATGVQEFPEDGVALCVPVTHENPVLILWISIWNGNQKTTEDSKATETTGCPVQS